MGKPPPCLYPLGRLAPNGEYFCRWRRVFSRREGATILLGPPGLLPPAPVWTMYTVRPARPEGGWEVTCTDEGWNITRDGAHPPPDSVHARTAAFYASAAGVLRAHLSRGGRWATLRSAADPGSLYPAVFRKLAAGETVTIFQGPDASETITVGSGDLAAHFDPAPPFL